VSLLGISCPCGGFYDEKRVEVRFQAVGDTPSIVINDVLQGACDSCGGRVYPEWTLVRIEAAMREAQAATR
jgi:hypothetical protein